jgi:hypothetical protein
LQDAPTSPEVMRRHPLVQINQLWSIAPAIARLNISAYNWRSNCLHGFVSVLGE